MSNDSNLYKHILVAQLVERPESAGLELVARSQRVSNLVGHSFCEHIGKNTRGTTVNEDSI